MPILTASLENIHQRLKAREPLYESDHEVLFQEIQQLCLETRVGNAMFDSVNAEARFGVLPDFKDITARRSKLKAWIEVVLRPPGASEAEDPLEDDDTVSEFTNPEDLAGRLESSAGSASDNGWKEAVGRAGVLLAQEEQELFLAYNYARHRLAQLLPKDVSGPILRTYPSTSLLSLARWTVFATDIRDLLVEFHYRFVVKRAHAARRIIGGKITVCDMFSAGVEGLRKAINAYDADKGAPRLVGFAPKYVNAEIIQWFQTETQWTNDSTRPVRKDNAEWTSSAKVERERIPDSEISAAMRDKGGWTVLEGEVSHRPPKTVLARMPLQSDPLKLDKCVAVAELRKAAALAETARNPLLAFKKSIRKADLHVDFKEGESINAEFAPPEWQAVWQRRMLSLHNAKLGRVK